MSALDGSFYGEKTGNQAGINVAIIGDVNADGYDDIGIGAICWSPTNQNDGKVYVVFGKATGWSMDVNISTADASFVGEGANQLLGTGVAPAGDVNGDGIDDFLVGANSFGSNRGKIYLIFGKVSGWTEDTPVNDTTASFVGDPNTYVGYYMAAGDLNADGYSDVIIGVPGASSNNGEVNVFFGKASGWTKGTSMASANLTIEGFSKMNAGAVSSNGDFNGDDIDDLFIGAGGYGGGGSPDGAAFMFFGRTSWPAVLNISAADMAAYGQFNGRFGGSVAFTGDVDKDGYDDVLVGESANQENAVMSGEAYIFFGDDDLDFWDRAYYISSVIPGASLGSKVYGAGDVDGDGYDDFLLGAPGAAGPGSDNKARAHLGLGWALTDGYQEVALLNASFVGESNLNGVGATLGGGGDVNGDGNDDIVLGARWQNANTGEAYVIFPEMNSVPDPITSVKAYKEPTYVTETHFGAVNDTIYIELRGMDKNSTSINPAYVQLSGSTAPNIFMKVRLMETGANTGIFRGNFTIKDIRDEDRHYFKASDWENISIVSTTDQTKGTYVYRTGAFELQDGGDPVTMDEDSPFRHWFWLDGPSSATLSTDEALDWLTWNSTNNSLEGTPDNSDVASSSVNVTASFMIFSDTVKLDIEVINTPPEVDPVPSLKIMEDKPFFYDLNGSDEGQGPAGWVNQTPLTWFTLDPINGTLNGTPTNDDVGETTYLIGLADGNGATVWVDVTITVGNTNDAPNITTQDVTMAIEDQTYAVKYTALDPDVGELLKWDLETNATWLNFDNTSTTLKGTPDNEDVGTYLVNLTVTDSTGVSDSHKFDLEVMNVNDGPIITSTPVTEAWAGQSWIYDIECTDVDGPWPLHLTMKQGPNDVTLTNAPLTMKWMPKPIDAGQHNISITVGDGNASAYQNFTLTVKVNRPPNILTNPPLTALVNVTYTYEPVVEDKDGDKLTWRLAEGPQGMVVNATTGKVVWIPTRAQLGLQQVELNVTDGKNGTAQSFTVTVVLTLNHDPNILNGPPSKTTIKTGKRFEHRVEANDPDSGDIITFGLMQGPPGMNVDSSSGLITWTPNNKDVGQQAVSVKISDGKGGVAWQNFTLTVVKSGSGGQAAVSPMLLGALIVVVAGCTMGAVLFVASRNRKRREVEAERKAKEEADAAAAAEAAKAQPSTVEIDDIFMVYRDGRLISHHTRKLRPNVDDQLLGSMFTAVQEFVTSTMGEQGATVNEISYGKNKILIEHGKYIYLAAVTVGEGTKKLHENIRIAVHNMEFEFGPWLETWNGDTKELEDAKSWIKELLEGKDLERLS